MESRVPPGRVTWLVVVVVVVVVRLTWLVVVVVVVVVVRLTWLGMAWLIEFRAENVFFTLWVAGLAFFAANVLIVREAIRLHHSTPLFRGGRLARQACLYGAEATGEEATAAGLFMQGLRSLDGTNRKESSRES